jgi:hypothetical protein
MGSASSVSRASTRRSRGGISFEDMAARRAERLVNLVICLLSTRQFLAAERIRDAVPGYEGPDGSKATDEAFKRMFERDKAELRELGVPLETGRNSHFDNEDGYRIRRGDYELPPIAFDAAEAAAVGLAARLWQSATLGEAARSALIKLRAAGTDVRATDAPGAIPVLDASDPSLPVLLDAARTATVRGGCFRGGGVGTSPASTATAANRVVSGSRGSSARCTRSAGLGRSSDRRRSISSSWWLGAGQARNALPWSR